MHSKISHMCRNVIMKMKTTNNLISKLFNPPSTSSAKAFGSLFCAGTRHLYLVSSPQGLGTVFALSICVHSVANTFYQYAWNIWINLWIIIMWICIWPASIPTNWTIFLAWPQGSCTLEEQKIANAWWGRPAVCEGGLASWVKIFWLLQYLYVMLNVYICMRWTMEVSTSLSFCFPLIVIIQENWS